MQGGYYFEIMLPGGLVGLIVGYATQKMGVPGFPRRLDPASKEIQVLRAGLPEFLREHAAISPRMARNSIFQYPISVHIL